MGSCLKFCFSSHRASDVFYRTRYLTEHLTLERWKYLVCRRNLVKKPSYCLVQGCCSLGLADIFQIVLWCAFCRKAKLLIKNYFYFFLKKDSIALAQPSFILPGDIHAIKLKRKKKKDRKPLFGKVQGKKTNQRTLCRRDQMFTGTAGSHACGRRRRIFTVCPREQGGGG